MIEWEQVSCRTCGRVFVSDRTPSAELGYCLWCRVGVPMVCARCSAACVGQHDGLAYCSSCRIGRIGEKEYEDKQRALLAGWQP